MKQKVLNSLWKSLVADDDVLSLSSTSEMRAHVAVQFDSWAAHTSSMLSREFVLLDAFVQVSSSSFYVSTPQTTELLHDMQHAIVFHGKPAPQDDQDWYYTSWE